VSRTLVVGFDGATLDLCERWMAEGRMPVLAGLAGDGAFAPLRSVFPFNSAVAWTSLSTGVDPGRHGVFDFVLPREGAYALRVATREDRRVPALWNHASEAGARVGVVNIPMTYPAEPLNGVMVSGMDAPSLDERAVHPAGLLERIHREHPGYRIMSKAYLRAEQGDFESAERELIGVLEARSRFVADLARPRDLDLLMVNLEATDGAHHFFWQHFDPSHPRHDPAAAERFGDTIGRVYQVTDRELGRLVDAFAPDTVFVVSDHGGGPSNDWVLYMNDWLAAEGFLSIRRKASAQVAKRAYAQAMKRMSVPLKRRLRPLLGRAIERAKGLALYGDVEWDRSRAYATVQSMVRLNQRGREPQGVVEPGARQAVLAELAERAGARRLPDGRPLFSMVAGADRIYRAQAPGDSGGRVSGGRVSGGRVSGGQVPGGPDLVVQPEQGTEVRGRNTSGRPGFLLRLSDLGGYYPSGVHTPVGMVVAAGTGIRRAGRGAEADIHQVAPSVLAAMGVPAPQLDAPPLPFVTAHLRSTGQELAEVESGVTDLDAEQEAEVLERLRGLGYVD
jgi:predicted AlkP superfamily phosphohydrolase/phosphomutase